MPIVGEEGVATTGPTDSQSLARLHVSSCLVSPNHFIGGDGAWNLPYLTLFT